MQKVKSNMNELRKKTIQELKALLNEKKGEKEKLSQDLLRGKENNINKLRIYKKEIAQISTVITEKNKQEN